VTLADLLRSEGGTMPSINSCQVSESHGLSQNTLPNAPKCARMRPMPSSSDVGPLVPHWNHWNPPQEHQMADNAVSGHVSSIPLQFPANIGFTWIYKTVWDFVHDQPLCAAPNLQWLEDIIPQWFKDLSTGTFTGVEKQVVDWSHVDKMDRDAWTRSFQSAAFIGCSLR